VEEIKVEISFANPINELAKETQKKIEVFC